MHTQCFSASNTVCACQCVGSERQFTVTIVRNVYLRMLFHTTAALAFWCMTRSSEQLLRCRTSEACNASCDRVMLQIYHLHDCILNALNCSQADMSAQLRSILDVVLSAGHRHLQAVIARSSSCSCSVGIASNNCMQAL
jgi:hypothetical protein